MELFPTETIGDSETMKRRIKKDIRQIEQGKYRQNKFNMLSKHVGKGKKASSKKVRVLDDKGELIAEYQDRKSIEEEVTKHNKKNFTQACSTKAHRNKM